jgi:hypothetical protein
MDMSHSRKNKGGKEMVETKLEEKAKEERKIDEKIAKIIMGKDYSALVILKGYEFEIHSLSIEDQIKVVIKSKNLRKDLTDDDETVASLTDMLATLDCAVSTVFKGNGQAKVKLNGGFLDNFRGDKNPKIFNTIIAPLFQKYAEFINELSITEDDLELKNV